MSTHMIYANSPEAQYFRRLVPSLIQDLESDGFFSRSQAEEICNFFDPAHEDYIARVDAWQVLLCKGRVPKADIRANKLPGALVASGVIVDSLEPGWMRLATHPADPCLITRVRRVHQVARLLIKYEGIPRKPIDMEAVKARFRRPGLVALTTDELDGIRTKLSKLSPPTWQSVTGRFGPGVSSDIKYKDAKYRMMGLIPRTVPSYLYNICGTDDFELSEACKGFDLSPTSDDHSGESGLAQLQRARYGITHIAEVPKSLKANRVVSSEPALFMYAQLAVGTALDSELHIHFPSNVFLHDQSKHNTLLRDPNYCSIDLSDASDHVSRHLVHSLLPLWRSLFASVRSTYTLFPDGTLVPLRTFAPMGSGLCFFVLTAICLGLCAYACSYPFHVYGDDIIVHKLDYFKVIDLLTRAGLVVNTKKSCYTGDYRESCGCEYFLSQEITPVLLRSDLQYVDSVTLNSAVRRFTHDGLLRDEFNATRLRIVSLWAETHRLGRCDAARWSNRYQRWEVIGVQAVVNQRQPVTDDLASYKRWLLSTAHRNGNGWVLSAEPRQYELRALALAYQTSELQVAQHDLKRRNKWYRSTRVTYKVKYLEPDLVSAVSEELEALTPAPN